MLGDLPDEVQPEVWNKSIKPNLRKGQAIGATHGFNFHFKTILAEAYPIPTDGPVGAMLKSYTPGLSVSDARPLMT